LESDQIPAWLKWAREIQAIAQTGSHFATDDYQPQRYQRLIEIAAEIFSAHTTLEADSLIENFGNQIGYATPRVDVRAAVFRPGELLLVQERIDGGWTLPGGWADVGERPSYAVEREAWEETGFRVQAKRLIGAYDANRQDPLDVFHAYKLLFLCDLMGGNPRPSSETSAVRFFTFDQIPTNFSGERTQRRHIEDAISVYYNQESPVKFD
jgi:ADP-ribose pyrophosphatase YjhB (NUDIX family)